MDSNGIRDEQHPVIGSVLQRNWQLQERLTIAEAELSDARQEVERLLAEKQEMAAALTAFVEAWEKSLQLEKTDVALRMAKAALERVSK